MCRKIYFPVNPHCAIFQCQFLQAVLVLEKMFLYFFEFSDLISKLSGEFVIFVKSVLYAVFVSVWRLLLVFAKLSVMLFESICGRYLLDTLFG